MLAPWTTVKFKLAGQSAQLTQQTAAAAASSTSGYQANSISQLYPNTDYTSLYPTYVGQRNG